MREIKEMDMTNRFVEKSVEEQSEYQNVQPIQKTLLQNLNTNSLQAGNVRFIIKPKTASFVSCNRLHPNKTLE